MVRPMAQIPMARSEALVLWKQAHLMSEQGLDSIAVMGSSVCTQRRTGQLPLSRHPNAHSLTLPSSLSDGMTNHFMERMYFISLCWLYFIFKAVLVNLFAAAQGLSVCREMHGSSSLWAFNCAIVLNVFQPVLNVCLIIWWKM